MLDKNKPRKEETWSPVVNRAGYLVIDGDKKIKEPFKWKRGLRKVEVQANGIDLFDPKVEYDTICHVFAVMASRGSHSFLVWTAFRQRYQQWMKHVKELGVSAQQRYVSELKLHFDRHKHTFTADYTLPDLPTPELRYIYDVAVPQENAEGTDRRNPRGGGFSGGEYHWRKWPLDNVQMEFMGRKFRLRS